MAFSDLHSNIFGYTSIPPLTVSDNTAQVGNIIDTQFFGEIEFVIVIGTLVDAAATFTILVEEGDDPTLSDAAQVPFDFLIPNQDPTTSAGFAGATDSDTVKRFGYVGDKQYVRCTITPVNNAAAATFGMVAIAGQPFHGAADENT